VPEGVRDVIGRRLSALPPELSDSLRVAAVVGQEFDASVVAAVAELDLVDVLDVLDTATQRGLVVETGRRGHWRFAHALVRQTLAEELSLGKRLRMHHRVALALEEGGADLVTLAHHFCEAAVIADADKAVALARRAGDDAMASLAWEQAVRWYRRALEAEESATQDRVRRCELLLALGSAMNAVGDVAPAREYFVEAADHARREGRADLLATAAIEYGSEAAFWIDPADQRGPALQLEALDALGPDDSVARAKLLAKQSHWATYSPALTDRTGPASSAVEMARRLGDDDALVYALGELIDALRGQPQPAERGALADEMYALGMRTGSDAALMYALWGRAHALVLGDDVELLSAAVGELGEIAARIRSALWHWEALTIEADIALRLGDPHGLELAEQARLVGAAAGPTAEFLAQLERSVTPTIVAGDEAAFGVAFGELNARFPEILLDGPTIHLSVAALTGNAIADIARWPASFAVAHAVFGSVAARRMRHAGFAAAIRPILTPWSGLFATGAVESAQMAGDHALAYLDIAEGELDAAVQRLRAAIALYEKNGFVISLRATVDLIEALVERDAPGDLAEASRLADAVSPRVAERGYDNLATRVAAALA
jgi:hypothetical protein